MKKNTCWRVSVIAIGIPLAAGAQTDPADPAAAAPALRYQSAFSDYRPWLDLRPADWAAFNEAVRPKPGAHAGHGAATPPAPAAVPQATTAPGPADMAPAHGGHHLHGDRK